MNPPVVLVDGGDATLVAEEARRAIDGLLEGLDRGLALEEHAGEEMDLAAIADACATPPFLVERRVVVVRDIGRFSADEVTPLLAYLDNPLPTTSLVLVAGEGRAAAKLVAAAKEKGRVVSATADTRRPDSWVHERVGRRNLRLQRDAEDLLARHLGEDLGRLGSILDVLEAAYGPGATIGAEDLEPYLGEAGSVTPWAFTDAIDKGDADEALRNLRRLLEGGDRHPLVVLAIVTRHVQSLLRVDGPAIRGEADAARALGIAPGKSTFPAKKAWRAAQAWGSGNIAEAVGLVADAEVDIKGASAWPPEAVLEVLVARLCRLARPRAGARR